MVMDDSKTKAKRKRALAALAPEASVTVPENPGDVVDRRAACRLSFRQFCETYFSGICWDEWGEDRLALIALIEQASRGEVTRVDMPLGRGRGLSTLLILAGIWFGCYAFVPSLACLVDSLSRARIWRDDMVDHWTNNTELQADFANIYVHQVYDGRQRARVFTQFVMDSVTETHLAFGTPSGLQIETYHVLFLDV